MREVATRQLKLLRRPVNHQHAAVLERMQRVLDSVLDEVGADVHADRQGHRPRPKLRLRKEIQASTFSGTFLA